MNVNLSNIIEAIEFTDDMTHSFLDKVTGKIVTVNAVECLNGPFGGKICSVTGCEV